MLVSVKVCTFLVIFIFTFVVGDEEPLSSARIIRPRCSVDKDCNPNAFCFGNDNYMPGHCKCNDGFEMFTEGKRYECLEELQLGQPCMKNVQCQVTAGALAICSGEDTQKFCSCNETVSHRVKNRCYETRYLDDFCQVDENCLLPDSQMGEDKFAICASVCSCPIGMKPSQNKKKCLEFKRLGHKCENDIQCQLFTENTVCREVCTCEAGFVRSTYLQTCLKAALKFDDPCTEDAQCSAHLEESICVKNRCSCPANYHGYLVRCRANALPGNACFDTGDCLIFKELKDKVECRRGVCSCVYGKSYDEHICLSGKSSTNLGDDNVLIASILLVSIMKVFIY
ncbi:cell death abnormality protein 1-like [Coccinella septempunctata]|uniref:cell death abnormality protein 1-like n=1 Tax=Coccinella septempunctata TaxID=41139 RepID=UPI001D073E88|nr:cell death abnormality protein 1-like [Coccinella septempunctata]